MKKIVFTDKAPKAIGAYSQAVWVGDFLFCSGQVGVDPGTGNIVGGGLKGQVEQVLKNISAVLDSQGLTFANVVKSLVFLSDMADFADFNETYGKVVGDEPPARSCVAVAGLPKGALVEIEVIACK